jgi:hypothetical protein
VGIIFLFFVASSGLAQDHYWKIHDVSRPKPPVVTPGNPGTQTQAGNAPSDAIVLFGGKDLSGWVKTDGEPATWKVENGYMEVSKDGGTIRTRQGFGDCQLHVEWSIPASMEAKGQGGGNSGVYLMGLYEVQVLNSYQNVTYADGQAGALYGQFPPAVNSSLPPGQWQTYDIIFHRPHFDKNGGLLQPAYITVLHNGVLIHNHVALSGPTEWQEQPPYKAHPDKLPIMLQDHGDPVRFRNIWIRDLEPGPQTTELVLTENQRKKYLGKYEVDPGFYFVIADENGQFSFYIREVFKYNIFPESETKFFSKKVDAQIDFETGAGGEITGLVLHMGGGNYAAKKVN